MSVRRTNRFWSTSLEHTLFLDFLKLFLNMRLVISFVGKKNRIFGPIDQKLWVFEVSRRSLGRAGMCRSQSARVDHLRKKWRAGRKKNSRKMGTA
jgi:ribosomal protein S30